MAVARLNKLKIIIRKSLSEELLKFLQQGGSMEIIDLKSCLGEDEYSLFFSKEIDRKLKSAEDTKGLHRDEGELLWLIDFMTLVNKARRYTLKKDEFQNIVERFDYRPIFEKTKRIEVALKELESSKKSLFEEKERLLPWQNLDVDLKDICEIGYVVKGLGIIRSNVVDMIKEQIDSSGLDLYVEQIWQSDHIGYIFFIYLKEDEDKLLHIFRKYSLERVYFPECTGKPAELLSLLEKRLKGAEHKRTSLIKELSDLATHKKEAMVLFDHTLNVRRKEDASAKLIMTERVSLIEGWVKKKTANVLKMRIENRFQEAEVFIEEPKPEEGVPVILENLKIFQPFELITKIYGMPAYNEVDPTPFLAPFFFIFFGFCLSDAGYGLVLFSLSFWVLKRFKMGWTGERFFRLLLYGGISTMILGALGGGWFGDIVDVLAKNNRIFMPLKNITDSLVLLNPTVEPMKLLLIALSLGIIQIWFGHIVAIYGNIKNRRYLDALLDQGSILIFLFGFTGIILMFLGILPIGSSSIYIHSFFIGAAAIAATSGRANPTVGSKLFYGLFNLYTILSGYISDILSYSRLWALGLVTGVMAMTFNLLAVLIGDMIPVVGFVVTISLLLIGHTMSLLMSLLGAFIHPLRLQFVEFFTKFFKGGGRDFQPLRLQNKFTVVE